VKHCDGIHKILVVVGLLQDNPVMHMDEGTPSVNVVARAKAGRADIMKSPAESHFSTDYELTD
jgi:hypothetical protein